MKTPVRYCKQCGAKCEVTASRECFDDKTGKPKYSYWSKCPNSPGKWFNRGHDCGCWIGGVKNFVTEDPWD